MIKPETNMMLLIVIISVILPKLALATESLSEIKIMLHKVSSNIEQSIDHNAIVDSLYKQIRPRARITNKTISSPEIDKRVRKYIKDKYAPALIANYNYLYTKLKSAKKDFSDCSHPEAMESGKDVLTALCVEKYHDSVHVPYLVKGLDHGWSKSAVFIFKISGRTLLFSGIELQLGEGVKAYVEGI